MLADPHPRSAHRASPASGRGLASLSPTALVRQAQAGHARARHAIRRQAQAGQARAHQAIIRQALSRPDRATDQPSRLPQPRNGNTTPGRAAEGRASATVPPAGDRESATLRPARHRDPARRPVSNQNSSAPPPTGDRRSAAPAVGRVGSGLHRSASASGRPEDGLPDSAQDLGFQTAVRLAAELQAASRLSLTDLAADQRPGTAGSLVEQREPAPHRTADPRRRSRPKRRAPRPAAGTRRPKRRAPRAPQETPQSLLRGLAAVIVLAIVGLSAFFIIAEERRGDGRESAAAAGSEPGIASRVLDAEPLTQREVFPDTAVQLSPGAAGYQVTMTHSDSECRTATKGELATLLDDHGCDQVIRARLTAPYGGYQVTAGIFNLADEAGAAEVSDLAGALVENGRGTFATLGGTDGDPLSEPLAQVGWQHRGHFLLYCVVARPDGQLVTDDDPYAATITAELVEQYLGERIVGQRTLDP
jgi:hypothetical protein